MKEHIFDFKVHTIGEYVCMSKKDWEKVLDLINSISCDWSVVEDDEEDQELSLGDEMH